MLSFLIIMNFFSDLDRNIEKTKTFVAAQFDAEKFSPKTEDWRMETFSSMCQEYVNSNNLKINKTRLLVSA